MNQRIDTVKLQNSHDFKEITFAITLLAGITAILIKITEYFNNNIISWERYFLNTIYFLVYILIIQIMLLLIFLLLKWYLLSTKFKDKKLKNFVKIIFQIIPEFTIISILISIIGLYFDSNPKIFPFIIIILSSFSILFILKYDGLKKIISLMKSIIKYIPSENIILNTFSIICIILLLLPIPMYLLMGNYSIELFSNTDNDIYMFTIKETGFPFHLNHITLYKINANGSSNFFKEFDKIIIDNTHNIHNTPSTNKLMNGIKHEGIWYLNINTSNLSSGNYVIHAEVTNDLSRNYFFGTIKKHDDKLFYVPPKNSNFNSNVTE